MGGFIGALKMELIYIIIAAAGLLCCCVLLWRQRRWKKRLDRLTAQIEHFILYPKEQLQETLSEGSVTNLYNQIVQLEQMLLLEQSKAKRQEQQMIKFVENMAHQMKNSLTALQMQLDMLELHTTDKAQFTLQRSQHCMNRMTDEIDKILKSSQLAEGKIPMAFEPVDLREEIIACRERLLPIAYMRNVTVKIEGYNALILPADSFWISQALENIIKNAVEYTAPDSTVTVSCFNEGKNIRIQITDNGAGIPPDELNTLFERFHRGETTKAGYGIGLSMAKDIIVAHHGKISVRNNVDCGAIFEILLPVLDGTSPYMTDKTEFQG